MTITLLIQKIQKPHSFRKFMKKCVLCSNNAVFSVKDTSEYYCEDCALENFSDIGALTRIDEKIENPGPEDDLQDQIDEIE